MLSEPISIHYYYSYFTTATIITGSFYYLYNYTFAESGSRPDALRGFEDRDSFVETETTREGESVRREAAQFENRPRYSSERCPGIHSPSNSSWRNGFAFSPAYVATNCPSPSR